MEHLNAIAFAHPFGNSAKVADGNCASIRARQQNPSRPRPDSLLPPPDGGGRPHRGCPVKRRKWTSRQSSLNEESAGHACHPGTASHPRNHALSDRRLQAAPLQADASNGSLSHSATDTLGGCTNLTSAFDGF